MELNNSFVRIDLDALKHNVDQVKKHTGVPVMAVIKADAYGHGAVPIARALAPHCAFFAVASISEAMELRRAGIQTPILILGHTPTEAYPLAVQHSLRPALFSYPEAVQLSQEATRQGRTAPFHFAVDTGMSRIGLQATEQSAELCARIAQLPNLEAEGIFSHFAKADEEDQSETLKQRALFDSFTEMLRSRGVIPAIRHMENSAALINFTEHYDMVRLGISLYGIYPDPSVNKSHVQLSPVLSWHTQVSFVKTLEKGRRISYGGTYTMERDGVIATIPVGYADGYRRCLSNGFYVLIRGKKAPIRGRVCMDQLLVDVTDIPGVCPGDPVTLIGRDGSEALSADLMAQAAGTISYEIVTGLSRRVSRHYIENGREVLTASDPEK